MFRFDMDYGRSCIYWYVVFFVLTKQQDNAIYNRYLNNYVFRSYELQIDEGYRSKGVGEHLMKALEKMAKIWNMERIVLTLLTNNEGAIRFYKRLEYTLDETSPDDEPAYDIMSKLILN